MKTQFIYCLAMVLAPFFLTAQSAGYDPQDLDKAGETMLAFMEKDPKFETYFEDAYAYIVFPSIGKGGYVIGGARGSGTVYEAATPIGKASLTQVTLGFQFGGQAYSQVIFFETEADFERFTQNKLEFAAEASAVAIKAGAGASLNYRDGVAVFTKSKAGFMYQAALGGQKLKFKPYKVIN
jgi:lipid-binding SYLF domain-containing protein